MDSASLAATISSTTAVLVAAITAVLTYALTKRRERDADWRKVKLELYKGYVIALSGVVKHGRTADDQIKYADAINGLTLVASPGVLKALYSFQDHVASNADDDGDRSLNKHLDALINALREDISPSKSARGRGLSFRLLSPPREGD